MTNSIENNTGEIILYQPDETIRLEVRLEDETVWLTQAQIVVLFQKAKSTISFHISNIFKEGELDERVVVRKNRTTTLHGAIEGKKQTHEVAYYNLDVIISVERIDAGLQRLQQLHNHEHSSQPVRIAAFTHPFHDRFLIVDDELWHCGASFKDLGRKLFALDKLQLDKNIILSQL